MKKEIRKIIEPLKNIEVMEETKKKSLREYGFKKIPFQSYDFSIFYGRDKEMAELSEYISKINKYSINYISIVGSTGIGKTALMKSYIGLVKESGIDLNFSYLTYDDFNDGIIDETLDENVFTLFIDSVSSDFKDLINSDTLRSVYGTHIKNVIVSLRSIHQTSLNDHWRKIFLRPLSNEEIEKIIHDNIIFSKKGTEEIRPFTKEAIQRISYFSMGNPGLSKKISYGVLLEFMKTEEECIGSSFVDLVVSDIFRAKERPSYEQINHIMKDHLFLKIVRYLLVSDRRYLSAMSDDLKVNRRLLYHKLRYLLEEGVVRTHSSGRKINYEINDIWKIIIENHLMDVNQKEVEM